MFKKYFVSVFILSFLFMLSGCYSSEVNYEEADKLSSFELSPSSIDVVYGNDLKVNMLISPVQAKWVEIDSGSYLLERTSVLFDFVSNDIGATVNNKTSIQLAYSNNISVNVKATKAGSVTLRAQIFINTNGVRKSIQSEKTIAFVGNYIYTVSDLLKLKNSSLDYELKQDINLTTNWIPIENFTGNLNGNGYSIRGLSIDSTKDNIGFFDKITGTIENLNIFDAQINSTGGATNVGVLAGQNKGILKNIHVTGIINTRNYNNVGGIVGYSEGSVIDSSSNIRITGNEYVGGIIGQVRPSNTTLIDNNKNYNNVEGSSYLGGIIGGIVIVSNHGADWTSSIINSKNEGNIQGTGDYVGGIIGFAKGNDRYNYYHNIAVNYSINSGNVSGKNYVGGIVGMGEKYLTEILSSVNTGDISGKQFVGGYLGKGNNTRLYSLKNNQSITGEAFVGGIAGYAGEVDNCENNGLIVSRSSTLIDNESVAYVGGIVGYANSVSNSINHSSITISHNGNHVGGIAGFINPKSNLSSVNNKNYGNIIAVGSSIGGIFGSIKILNAVNVNLVYEFKDSINTGNVTSNSNEVGGFVGSVIGKEYYNNTNAISIMNVQNEGTIIGKDYTGGIVGKGTNYLSNISNSTNKGDVTGKHYVGGYIGYGLNTRLDNLTNLNSITGYAYVGGIAGYAGVISTSQNNGKIQSIGVIIIDSITYSYVGGIAGYSTSLIDNKNNQPIAVSNQGLYVGGIGGFVKVTSESMIEYNENTGNVSSNGKYTGGIVGLAQVVERYSYDWTAEFSNNINHGDITSNGDYCGGIFGRVTGNNYYSDEQSVSISSSINYGDISGSNYVGGILGGSAEKYESISNSRNEGTIMGYSFVGGISGSALFVINSTNTGLVTGLSSNIPYSEGIFVGGIVGRAKYITNNINEGTIFNQSIAMYTGGIAGYISDGPLNSNLNKGAVTSTGHYTGGVAGFVKLSRSVDIDENSNSNMISGMFYVGGLFGGIELSVNGNNSILINSSNSGDVTGRGECVGGIVGIVKIPTGTTMNYNALNNSGVISGSKKVGGIVGHVNGGYLVPSSSSCTNTGVIDGSSEFGDYYGKIS